MNDSVDIQELIMGERKSLHDISNHLVVAQGMAGFVLKSLKKHSEAGIDLAKEIERLEKTIAAVEKITNVVQERRALLHTHSADKK